MKSRKLIHQNQNSISYISLQTIVVPEKDIPLIHAHFYRNRLRCIIGRD